tara:strand:- start:78621 stop:78752 length:132 start_codon:yes stop_codon:yes gene_type:complete
VPQGVRVQVPLFVPKRTKRKGNKDISKEELKGFSVMKTNGRKK